LRLITTVTGRRKTDASVRKQGSFFIVQRAARKIVLFGKDGRRLKDNHYSENSKWKSCVCGGWRAMSALVARQLRQVVRERRRYVSHADTLLPACERD